MEVPRNSYKSLQGVEAPTKHIKTYKEVEGPRKTFECHTGVLQLPANMKSVHGAWEHLVLCRLLHLSSIFYFFSISSFYSYSVSLQ